MFNEDGLRDSAREKYKENSLDRGPRSRWARGTVATGLKSIKLKCYFIDPFYDPFYDRCRKEVSVGTRRGERLALAGQELYYK